QRQTRKYNLRSDWIVEASSRRWCLPHAKVCKGTRSTSRRQVSALQTKQGQMKRGLLRLLGPGLITGASDDDPSGIATDAQVGAQFGYGMAWVMLFSYPLMAAIQEISARIGRVTGQGIAGNIRQRYPAWVVRVVGLLVLANIINLGADLGAMGEALGLLL